jgi:hypothetical protein
MSNQQRDLFGNKTRPKTDRLEADLKRQDKYTFSHRLERLRFLNSIVPPNGMSMFGNIEPIFIFEEARLTYLNGAFIATILLCQAFIEHWLQSYLSGRVETGEIPETLNDVLRQCRQEGFIHKYLIDKIDTLRKVRNPFTHRKSEGYPFLLSRRMFDKKMPPEDILEQDAKDALSIMHTLFLGRGKSSSLT